MGRYLKETKEIYGERFLWLISHGTFDKNSLYVLKKFVRPCFNKELDPKHVLSVTNLRVTRLVTSERYFWKITFLLLFVPKKIGVLLLGGLQKTTQQNEKGNHRRS